MAGAVFMYDVANTFHGRGEEGMVGGRYVWTPYRAATGVLAQDAYYVDVSGSRAGDEDTRVQE